jgi:hypothetical protein
MKKRFIQFVLVYLLGVSVLDILFAQSFSTSIKYEPFLFIYKVDADIENEFSFFGIDVTLGYKINNRLQAEFQTGFNYVDSRYRGIDAGLRVRSFLFEAPIFFSGGFGITFLRNVAMSHSFRSYEKQIYFGSIGIGVNSTSNIVLQLTYRFPIGNNEIGHAEYSILNPENKRIIKYKMVGTIKIGLGYAISL